MKIDSVVVLCWSGDFRLARICLASIRYFYPDIPLYLVKDTMKGDFCTKEVEQTLRLTSAGLSGAYGPGVGKLELLFNPGLGRFLFMDADEIMVGPVLDTLACRGADFVVTPDSSDPASDVFDRIYYDRCRIALADPDFRPPPFYFNTGQFIATGGRLDRKDFEGLVRWGRPIQIVDQQTFKLYEQGVLNYVLQKKASAGVVTIDAHEFVHLARTDLFYSLPLSTVKTRQAPPLLFHWAGVHRLFVCCMRRRDLLRFFEDFYYSHLPRGTWLRWKRKVQTSPARGYLALRQNTISVLKHYIRRKHRLMDRV